MDTCASHEGEADTRRKEKIQSNMSEDEKEVDLESSDDVSDLVYKILLFILFSYNISISMLN